MRHHDLRSVGSVDVINVKSVLLGINRFSHKRQICRLCLHAAVFVDDSQNYFVFFELLHVPAHAPLAGVLLEFLMHE